MKKILILSFGVSFFVTAVFANQAIIKIRALPTGYQLQGNCPRQNSKHKNRMEISLQANAVPTICSIRFDKKHTVSINFYDYSQEYQGNKDLQVNALGFKEHLKLIKTKTVCMYHINPHDIQSPCLRYQWYYSDAVAVLKYE